MKRTNLFIGALLAAIVLGLQGCAVNVVTVNVVESDLGYVDQGVSEPINESNLY